MPYLSGAVEKCHIFNEEVEHLYLFLNSARISSSVQIEHYIVGIFRAIVIVLLSLLFVFLHRISCCLRGAIAALQSFPFLLAFVQYLLFGVSRH